MQMHQLLFFVVGLKVFIPFGAVVRIEPPGQEDWRELALARLRAPIKRIELIEAVGRGLNDDFAALGRDRLEQ
jgi:hypothetical protein